LEWVRKMPKARGTKAKYRVDAFENVKEKAFSKKAEDKLELSVKMTRMGGKILELVSVNKAFGEKKILDQFTYTFKRGERIGIMGPNGIGKSTFLNILQGVETIDSGTIQTGETIVFGYYSQKGLKLNEDKRVIEVVKDIAEFIPLADGSKLSASQLLQKFQFSGDMQYSLVSKLSGGEKRRLYLLTVLVKNPNFLVLDEPTNDLDIITLSVLEDFLLTFGGCLIIVTHDRYFMDKLIDHLFVFEGNGKIKDFPGTYTEYSLWKATNEKNDVATANKTSEKAITNKTDTLKPVKKASFKEKYEFEQLTKEIEELEIEKHKLNEKLSAQLPLSQEEVATVGSKLLEITNHIDEKSMRWLELSELLAAKE